jgi:IS30 family transposase
VAQPKVLPLSGGFAMRNGLAKTWATGVHVRAVETKKASAQTMHRLLHVVISIMLLSSDKIYTAESLQQSIAEEHWHHLTVKGRKKDRAISGGRCSGGII